MRIDALIGPYRQLPSEQARIMLTDKRFLLDTLESDDPALRDLARKQLQTVLGHPLAFDTQADKDARRQAVEALRRQLLSTPATRP